MQAKTILMVALMVVALNNVAKAKSPSEPVTAPEHTNTITGVVLDKSTGELLTGVEVYVEGADLKTYTDFDGKFVFKNVKTGKYKVMANYISYGNNETKAIEVNNNELHVLNLEMETVDK